eukprot:CAMPEP_0167798660 /NCGR_PEP_ID=MMETSP0111_2-20121227/16480_1 /TAXON_ID=91324 /ORGANISM="Lotharella globosa, Strain CCCM811" /LENGTH=39 /DNA_ID= /DNA_START= /DNA_END= /DNA_ORIENTATION=
MHPYVQPSMVVFAQSCHEWIPITCLMNTTSSAISSSGSS